MARIYMNKENEEERPRIDFNKRIRSMEVKVEDARHHAEEWEDVAVREGTKKLQIQKQLADEKRHRLYERIMWLLLSISLVLVQHL